jgi:hypothetical protein
MVKLTRALVILDESDGLTGPAQERVASLVKSFGPRGVSFVLMVNRVSSLVPAITSLVRGEDMIHMDKTFSLDNARGLVAQTPWRSCPAVEREEAVAAAFAACRGDVRAFLQMLQTSFLLRGRGGLQEGKAWGAVVQQLGDAAFEMWGAPSRVAPKALAGLWVSCQDAGKLGVPASAVLKQFQSRVLRNRERLPRNLVSVAIPEILKSGMMLQKTRLSHPFVVFSTVLRVTQRLSGVCGGRPLVGNG